MHILNQYNMLFLIGRAFEFIGGICLAVGIIGALVGESTKEKEIHKKSENKAIDILKERYAKGKITKEEYEQMKKDLEN